MKGLTLMGVEAGFGENWGVFLRPLVRVDSVETDTLYWAPLRGSYAENMFVALNNGWHTDYGHWYCLGTEQ